MALGYRGRIQEAENIPHGEIVAGLPFPVLQLHIRLHTIQLLAARKYFRATGLYGEDGDEPAISSNSFLSFAKKGYGFDLLASSQHLSHPNI